MSARDFGECADCKFWGAIGVSKQIGDCQKYPPKAFPPPKGSDVGVLTVWPMTEEGDWCGEFEAANE
jgi:hypothetical protein